MNKKHFKKVVEINKKKSFSKQPTFPYSQMFNFLLGNCNCYSTNGPDISAEIELFNLDIVEALSNEEIKIYLDLKFSLNCTTVSKGDVIYLSKYIPDIRRDTKLRGQDLLDENMLYLEEDAESSYSGLVQNTFDLVPDM